MDNTTAQIVSNTYTKKERNAYLIGLLGQNMMYNVVGSCLMYFLQFTVLPNRFDVHCDALKCNITMRI